MRLPIATGRGRLAGPGGPLLAIFAVLLELSATLGGSIHLALVKHERCPEHGELIHASSDDAGVVRSEARASRVSDQDRPAAAPGGQDAHDSHDPCSLTVAQRQRTEPGACSSGRNDPPRERAGVTADDGAFRTARAGYRVAPKTSPPRHV